MGDKEEGRVRGAQVAEHAGVDLVLGALLTGRTREQLGLEPVHNVGLAREGGAHEDVHRAERERGADARTKVAHGDGHEAPNEGALHDDAERVA